MSRRIVVRQIGDAQAGALCTSSKSSHAWQALALMLLLYVVCLLTLVSKYPLWLDEIIDLRAIRDLSLQKLIVSIPANAGGVPLGYLSRFASTHILGFSIFSGRLPSVIFSVVACLGVFLLGRQVKLRLPLFAVFIFCLAPLQLRYAIESRPYSQVLAISIWATFVFLQLLEHPTFVKAVVYTALTLVGLYSQPYVLFVVVAHFIWLCLPLKVPFAFRLRALVGGAIAVSCLGFLPWYLWANKLWNESVQISHLRYQIDFKSALLVVKELVGAGYIGTLLVVVAVILGLKSNILQRNARIFWILQVLVPIIMAVIADQVFGYFLAIRQMIFVLVPLSILAALGLEQVGQENRRAALIGRFAICLVFVIANVEFYLKPREDWATAIAVLQQTIKEGSCVIFSPVSIGNVYSFLDPNLAKNTCSLKALQGGVSTIAVASVDSRELSDTSSRLSNEGFFQQNVTDLHGPEIRVYRRIRVSKVPGK